MRIALAADHGGYALKSELTSRLGGRCTILDLGAHELDPTDDYPDYADAVSLEVAAGRADRGIVICGSGVGACIVANKVPGVRACLCHDTYSAHQGVEHDNMNVLCLGARVIGLELAAELTHAFLNARFSREERHLKRLQKVSDVERRAIGQGGPAG